MRHYYSYIYIDYIDFPPQEKPLTAREGVVTKRQVRVVRDSNDKIVHANYLDLFGTPLTKYEIALYIKQNIEEKDADIQI